MIWVFVSLLASAAAAGELVAIGEAPAGAPVGLVVHGINPTPGELDPLAENLAERGFRTLRFDYDSHDRLEVSAAALGAALRRTIVETGAARVLVVAHSMGGLVARRALTDAHEARIGELPVQIDLVTVASPLGGFRSANWSWLSFGFAPSSFRDLGTESRFIQEPGRLAANVRHTKVETLEDEALRLEDGRWVDDDVVGLESQVNPLVDAQAVQVSQLKVGHTSAVNVYGYVHPRLVELLDRIVAERPDSRVRVASSS